MKALLDTNIILDDALAREPFDRAANAIVEACARGEFQGYLSAIAPLNAFYVARRLIGSERARDMVGKLLQLFEICPLDMQALQTAYASGQPDIEDAAQLAAALAAGIEVIVTRDPRGFSSSPISVLSPDDFLQQLSATGSNPTSG